MTKDEKRMTKEARNPKSEVVPALRRFGHLRFDILSSFAIRHSSF